MKFATAAALLATAARTEDLYHRDAPWELGVEPVHVSDSVNKASERLLSTTDALTVDITPELRVISMAMSSAKVGDEIEPEVVDTKGASRIVGFTESTLVTYRSRGGGPRYVKKGRKVVYRIEDLRAWRDSGLVSSTAETET